ncbi:MAG TPA: hypothetical protein VLH59_13810 [Ignavibacteriaceae bacterium]|nr:hypothetical protein [Ignavibacteriaceae bacterium]
MANIFKKNNYLAVYLFIIGVINLFLQTLPLTNVFGYEFSAINALLLSFLSGLFSISLLKSLVKENKKFNVENFISALRWMIFLPFAISVINSIIFGFCSFTDGLLFYLVITFPSVIIGSAIGTSTYFLVNKFRVTAFIVFYSLILFIPVLEIYFNPQIYLYNPLFAYFPGTIYDEGLSVDLKLTLYRFFNVVFFLSILVYLIKYQFKNSSIVRRKSFLFLTIGIAAIFYFLISPQIGFTTTESRLKDELSFYIESNHFIIQADRRITKAELQQIVVNQEYYYSQLSKYFAEEPKTKINSFIFFDSQQKKDLFGSGAADVAKPWLNSIYVSCDSWESTLKHEIAHCFTANFGTGIFKLASGFNPALIEGVAEAADGFYDENSIHHLATLAYRNDNKVNLNTLFKSFSFFGSVSSLSYIYSGSFIEFLETEYGIEKVKEYYRTNDFQKSFEADLIDVVKNYEMFLDTSFAVGTKHQANYYFGRKSLISKVCPRYVSSSLTKAWQYYSEKNYEKAGEIFEDILSKAENYSAIVGLSKIYEDTDSLAKAIHLLHSSLEIFNGTSTEYDLKFRLAELYVKNSEPDKAKEIYNYLSNANPSRRIGLLANTRISLMQNGSIENYVKGSDYDRYAVLKNLNSKAYNYSSIPLMIDLSNSLEEDYKKFLQNFVNHLEVKDELSSYSVYKLSEYMLKNFDYANARKMAGFALRYKGDANTLKLTEDHYKKTEWFFRNAKRIIDETNFELN